MAGAGTTGATTDRSSGRLRANRARHALAEFGALWRDEAVWIGSERRRCARWWRAWASTGQTSWRCTHSRTGTRGSWATRPSTDIWEWSWREELNLPVPSLGSWSPHPSPKPCAMSPEGSPSLHATTDPGGRTRPTRLMPGDRATAAAAGAPDGPGAQRHDSYDPLGWYLGLDAHRSVVDGSQRGASLRLSSACPMSFRHRRPGPLRAAGR